MSFVSIIIPAFYCNMADIESAKSYLSSQMKIQNNDFQIFPLSPANEGVIEYGVRLNNSTLSLMNIQNILQEKDNLLEKIKSLEQNIIELNRVKEVEDKSLISSKIKDLISMHIESSESFRVNTERTLNKIKEEFEIIVGDLDGIKKLDSQRQNLNSKRKENDYSFKNNFTLGNSLTSRSKAGNSNNTKNSMNNRLKTNNQSPVINNKLRFSSNTTQVPQLNLKMNINLTNINNNMYMDKQEQSSKDNNPQSSSSQK